MADSPNPLNYSILKANVWWTPDGGARRHLGNAPAANLNVEVEKLDHFSSMAGIRTRDKSFVTGKTATLTLQLDEFTLPNLQLAMLGGDIASGDNTEGDLEFDIGSSDAVTGRVEIIGTNDVGNRVSADLPSVSFVPSEGIDFISEEVATIQLEGDVNAVTVGEVTSFGKVRGFNTATE